MAFGLRPARSRQGAQAPFLRMPRAIQRPSCRRENKRGCIGNAWLGGLLPCLAWLRTYDMRAWLLVRRPRAPCLPCPNDTLIPWQLPSVIFCRPHPAEPLLHMMPGPVVGRCARRAQGLLHGHPPRWRNLFYSSTEAAWVLSPAPHCLHTRAEPALGPISCPNGQASQRRSSQGAGARLCYWFQRRPPCCAACVHPRSGMSYAALAGLPNVFGLYGAMVASLVYCLFGSSRQLVRWRRAHVRCTPCPARPTPAGDCPPERCSSHREGWKLCAP